MRIGFLLTTTLFASTIFAAGEDFNFQVHNQSATAIVSVYSSNQSTSTKLGDVAPGSSSSYDIDNSLLVLVADNASGKPCYMPAQTKTPDLYCKDFNQSGFSCECTWQ